MSSRQKKSSRSRMKGRQRRAMAQQPLFAEVDIFDPILKKKAGTQRIPNRAQKRLDLSKRKHSVSMSDKQRAQKTRKSFLSRINRSTRVIRKEARRLTRLALNRKSA